MSQPPDRPSVPHHLSNPHAVPRRTKTGPQNPPHEWPAAKPTGDMAAKPVPAVSSLSQDLAGLGIDPAMLAAFDLLERNVKAIVNLGMNQAVGAQQSAELTTVQRKLEKQEQATREANWTAFVNKVWALAIAGVALAVTIVLGWAFTNARNLFKDEVPSVAAEAVEAKVDPLEKRVASTEQQVAEVGEDVAAVGRKVDQLARAVGQLVNELDEQQTPQQRKRPR